MNDSTEHLKGYARRMRQEQPDPETPNVVEIQKLLADSEDIITRMRSRQMEREQRLRDYLRTVEPEQRCGIHGLPAKICFEESLRVTGSAFEKAEHKGPTDGTHCAVYVCPMCDAEANAVEYQRLNLPKKYWTAKIDDLTYDTARCQENQSLCREYLSRPRGFLVLLGAPGNGKTHIAAAIIRERKGFFLKQSELVAGHRKTYRDDRAPDLRARAMKASLLALDEIGVAAGGNDAETLLYEVLDARYSNQLPTIITSNLVGSELRESLGPRLVDRIEEAAFHVLRFTEPSKRKHANAEYLEGL